MRDGAGVGMDDDADVRGVQLGDEPASRREDLTDGFWADGEDDLVEVFETLGVGRAVEDGDGEALCLPLDVLDDAVELQV